MSFGTFFKSNWKWIVSGLSGTVLTFGAWAFNDRMNVGERISTVETKTIVNDKDISKIDVKMDNLGQTLLAVKQDVGEINGKIDLLVQQNQHAQKNQQPPSVPANEMREVQRAKPSHPNISAPTLAADHTRSYPIAE